MSHPFGSSFASLNAQLQPIVDSIHDQELSQLKEILKGESGQLISLRAPRAGYGKTTLLSRLRDFIAEHSAVVSVPLAAGKSLEAELVLEEALNQLLELSPNHPSATCLDIVVRQLFAQALLPMVRSGEVPCQDQAAAIISLETRPEVAFDFQNEGAAIAHWTQQQFQIVGPRLTSGLAKLSRTPSRYTSAWLRVLFDYASQPTHDLSRADILLASIFDEKSGLGARASFLELTGAFLNLISLVQPVVLILDEIEGLSEDPDAALAVVSQMTALWQAAPRTQWILSVNDDIWESAFVPKMPDGLRDRLEDHVVRLQEISLEQIESLIKKRAEGLEFTALKELLKKEESLYPRRALKLARQIFAEEAQKKKAEELTRRSLDHLEIPSPIEGEGFVSKMKPKDDVPFAES